MKKIKNIIYIILSIAIIIIFLYLMGRYFLGGTNYNNTINNFFWEIYNTNQ